MKVRTQLFVALLALLACAPPSIAHPDPAYDSVVSRLSVLRAKLELRALVHGSDHALTRAAREELDAFLAEHPELRSSSANLPRVAVASSAAGAASGPDMNLVLGARAFLRQSGVAERRGHLRNALDAAEKGLELCRRLGPLPPGIDLDVGELEARRARVARKLAARR